MTLRSAARSHEVGCRPAGGGHPWTENTLSYKAICNGSNEKEYIGTLKCLDHTHPIYLNPFSFKVHETGTAKYQTLVGQARKYRIGNVSYSENQALLEQEHQGLTLNQKPTTASYARSLAMLITLTPLPHCSRSLTRPGLRIGRVLKMRSTRTKEWSSAN